MKLKAEKAVYQRNRKPENDGRERRQLSKIMA